MGLYFRRSKKAGPLNFTVSKSGFGASIGAGPVRITHSTSGRKSVNVRGPLKGIGYRKYFK